MGLGSASIRTFNDLGEAFVKQYKYNVDTVPDKDQLRSMSQKDKETFKDAPSDFTEMVNMGMRLKEGVREGRLSRDEASTSKRYDSNFGKKKDSKTNAISSGRQRRPQIIRNPPSCQQHHHQVFSFITQQNFERKKVSFDPIPMSYAEPYPSLVLKNLIQPRNPPQIPEPLPWWYKPELRCAFHQGAPEHDIENCYPLKYEVQKLMKSGMVSFEDRAPNVKANSLPAHGNSFVNMVDGCPGEFKVFDVRFIRRSLVNMHKDVYLVSEYADVNVTVSVFKQPEKLMIQYDSSNSNSQRSVSLLDGEEVPLPTTSSMVSIADVTKVTRSGRVFGLVFLKDKEEAVVSKKVEVPVENPVGCSKDKSGESSNLKPNDDDEVLRLIKRSEFNVVEQLLQTPSKISVCS
ncbi:hypothetical protein KIW84_011684 [Lathyrus oleraceus]|uniref:Uncharacterized protein n=1 Tax=Pisum sativum TaxID=3888 RepID=A0A9D5BFP5_PEA|nr:hypothetical protein KIW84_011684 [Pisum sativum]